MDINNIEKQNNVVEIIEPGDGYNNGEWAVNTCKLPTTTV